VWRVSFAALIISAAWVGYFCLYQLVLHPLLGTILEVITFGLGQWLLGFVTVYIATLTCIEKILDVDMERSHALAWSVTIATGVLGFVASIGFGILLAALMASGAGGG
jgi:hypothetical protein